MKRERIPGAAVDPPPPSPARAWRDHTGRMETPGAAGCLKTLRGIQTLLRRARVPPDVFHLSARLPEAQRASLSTHVAITRTGMHLPLDLRRGRGGVAVHTDPVHGGAVPFAHGRAYDDLVRSTSPVRIVARREGVAARLRPRRTRDSLLHMRRIVKARAREHVQDRHTRRRVHDNAEPIRPSSGAFDANGRYRRTPRRRPTQPVWERLRARECLLPAFQPCMVGLTWCEELACDDRLVEVLPSWFVYSPRVRATRVTGYVAFLKSRYSTIDWERLMRQVVPDCVFGEDPLRVHYQNLTCNVFMRMRLATCVLAHDACNLARGVDALGLCEYYRRAFV